MRKLLAVSGLSALLATALAVGLRAGSLSSVSPTGASVGITVNITGTGFNTTATNNDVVFTPAAGAPVIAKGATIATLDANTGLRRLSVIVPAGVPVGTTALRVVNRPTGETSEGRSIEVIALALPAVTSGPPGATNLAVRITGSPNTQFVSGTKVTFGAGIAVTNTTIESPTSLIATISIAANAAIGPREINTVNSPQSARLPGAFSVQALPPNRPPTASSGGPYAGNTGVALSFSGAGNDPDNDPLTFTWNFGDGSASAIGAAPSHTYALAGSYTATLTVTDGKGGSASSQAGVVVTDPPPPNRNPTAGAGGPYTGTAGVPVIFTGSGSDPDGDTLGFSWEFGDLTSATDQSPVHTYSAAGNYSAVLTVSDGRGGSATSTATVTIAAAATLLSLDVEPPSLRFAQRGATTALSVTGLYSDGTTRLLTIAPGTTYLVDSPQVATIDESGLVTARGNGSASITVSAGGRTQVVRAVVEEGVLLQSLELTPPVSTLRDIGATTQATLWGDFSDGSRRNLTSDAATIFTIDAVSIASISATGVITSLAEGSGTLTARNGGIAANALVRVLVTAGAGFLRGEVFDDSRGVPLSAAAATLLQNGNAGQQLQVDDRGRFVVSGAAGAALVRVERSGFTTVERTAVVPRNGVATLLDARLTPLDTRLNLLQSVFGGQASSTDGGATVAVPPGSLQSDLALRVTPLSNQGLQGLLPPGWSPIAAVDLQPAGRRFAQPATLRLPHIDTLAAGSAVTLAAYDVATHQWMVQSPGRVSDDRRSLSGSIEVTGQYAFVVADDAPLAPPAATPGDALAGLTFPIVPNASTASGQVVPRSAPPGDNARAMGTIVLQPASPLSSGAVVRARVSEQFDLLDSSRVRPLPFVQDLVLYARPRLGGAGALATRLPITPTLQFSIQQLSLGQVRLDVTADEPSTNSAIVGAGGGSLSDEAGDVLYVPAGALTDDAAVGLIPIGANELSIPVPESFTLLGAAFVDFVGGTFTQPALLSIARPSTLDPAAQVVVARVITDGSGGRRFKLVGLGQVTGTRLSVQAVVGTTNFEGVRAGGEYAFLRPSQPLGFVSGIVNAAGASPQSSALVTADTAPFATVTDATGTFIVAGRVGVPTTVAAIEPAGATAYSSASLAALNDVATLTLTLAQTAPAVLATSPGTNASGVALDSSIIVDFSKPIDPATITASSVVVGIGQVNAATQLVLSANRRRLTITPASPLAGLTTYTLTLTSAIRDSAGVPLAAFAPRMFTTLDPSKATALALGVISAELPDDAGVALITGAPGAADSESAIVATNLRSQETVTVLALADGSFRLRLAVIVGDEVALTLRDTNRRETTISITQFSGRDGTTSIGQAGGTIIGANGRVGRVLPRSLSTAGIFHLIEAGNVPLPALGSSFAVVDRFALTIDNAAFRRVGSLTLTESQGRFAPATALATPFASSGQLTIPADFLVSASLRFSATVADQDGVRHSAGAATVVVPSSPDTASVETGFGDQFPTVFVNAPKQAVPTNVIEVSALAPSARVEFDLPTSSAAQPGETLVLARLTELNGATKLAVVDRMTRLDAGGAIRLRTSGRDLPGATRGGEYAVVSGPIAFVTGRASGPAATVSADGSPFIFETDGANGAFTIPVLAGAPFTLHFSNTATGASLGDIAGQAPQAGVALNLGQPLAPVAGSLTVSVQPDAQSVVEIAAPLVFTFSEPLDQATVTASAFVVTDPAGARAFGSVALGADRKTVTFVPARRWRFNTTYRYGVGTTVIAASGARLQQAAAGEFTTFAPRVVSTSALGSAADVAVSGALALVATGIGGRSVDVSAAATPQPLGQVAMPGGGRGVALVPSPTLVDRNGQNVSGAFAVIVGGDATGSRLQLVDVSTPSAPVVVATTQLSPAAGAPRSVLATADGRALVAIEGVGLVSVRLGQMLPANAQANDVLGPRFPAAASEDIVGVAQVGDRLLVTGAAGLQTLDAVTLARRGGVATGGPMRDVAALSSFAFDDTIDLALATGTDGTLQFFRVPQTGDPVLISVVRFSGEATSVALSSAERLAYVGLGPSGVAIVDLDGPASVQPLDDDHNGTDDRILAVLDTPASAARISLALERGLGFVADGPGGLAVVQLLPPRVRFTDLLRDPVRVVASDERSIADTLTAFLSDDALRVTIQAIAPPREPLVFVVEGGQSSGSTPIVTLPGGGTAAPVSEGTNTIELLVNHATAVSAQTIRMAVKTAAGAVVASRTVNVVPAQTGSARLMSMRLGPANTVLGDNVPTVQLGVAGFYDDGRVFNVTQPAVGTIYRTERAAVATVDSAGTVAAGAGGIATITATNAGAVGSLQLRVDRPAALVALEATTSHLTLRSIGEQTPFPVVGILSDGSSESDLTRLPPVIFGSTVPSVAVAGADGLVRGIGPGQTTLSASSAGFEATVEVAVDPRTPASISGISILPAERPLSLDDSSLVARARLDATGALDGHVVTVTVTAGSSTSVVSLQTDLSGIVEFNLDAAHLAGQVSATASVVDPSTGSVRADTETFTIAQASADQEPNNSVAAASPLGTGGTVSGVLNGTTDSQDVYRFDSDLDGTLEIQIAIAEGGATGPLVLVVRDASGNELRRLTLSDRRPGVVSVAVPAGAAFVTVESSGSASYSISSKFEQADVAVSSVSPMSGPAGTLITINGSGFSSRVLENQVFFSNIAAEVVSATTTQLLVRVPANAVNGAVEVISGDRRFELEGFSTGVATARPKGYGLPSNASAMRQDPTTGELIDITRLVVSATPATDQQSMAATAQRLGGQVVGYVPLSNQYFLEFNQNSSLDGLNAIRRRVEAEPAVRSVDFSRAPRATSVHAIDMLDGSDPTVRRKAFELIHLPEAIDLIRTTPPFIDASGLKTVRVAVIDSGFQPSVPGEFPGTVEFYRSEGLAGLLPSTNFRDVEPSHPDGHGTEVTSVIAALNDEVTPVSGFLNSLVSAQEAPFGVVNYGWLSNLDQVGIYLALENIKTRGNIDVVNMSLAFNADISTLVQALRGRTLVVAAAGNDGIRNTDKPARLASTEPNVMAVGAVAVANIDGSGETADQRARFQGAQGALSAVSARCDPLDTGPRYSIAGSNCGPSITIAAPGEDLYAVTKAGSGPDHKYFGGTSGASPVVASIAAILQAVRPTLAPLPPSDVRSILKRTATDISSSWGSPMGRVDALAAVESLLAPHSPETVLVTDGEAPPTTGSQPGALVAFTVDGLTGLPTQASQTIDLNETGEDIGHPRTIAVAPDGNAAYVFAETAGAQGGEGLVVVSARNRKALNFIPLSGTRGANPPTPLRTGDPRPPMVVSKDGRIVYVAAGKRLHVVNAVDGLDVFSFADLPAPYNALASQVSGSLEQKFQALDSNLDAGAVTARPATRISALALSPDGATLFMTIQSAGGAGVQPGYVLALNVNLYSDASSDYGLQSDLTNYLLPAKYFGPSYAIPHSDEPSDVAVSPDGRFLYVVNGGFASFSPPDLTKSATTYGLSVATESNGGVTVVTADQQARNKEEFESGYTVMNAPGVIEAYPTETNGPGGPRFPSTIDYGWQPSAASGGLVLSPYRFPYVFGRRPFSISIRPDGQRALVAFFQTGNFGVMDLDAQRFFAPSARNVAAGYFAGIVGLTPSVKLDKNLWPLRDQFDLPGGGKASPDEKLLFPTQVEYSQSGRFAVGIHTGATRPVPPTTPGSNEGGAVSFINDEVIGRDLTANASSIFEPSFDGTRAYYSMNPICDTANTATNSCVSSPVTSVFDYTSGGQSKRFAVPRGLAIAPEFSVVTPAFGDHIVPTGEITLRWSGDPVVVRFRLLEGGTVSAPTNYGPLTNGAIYFSADERLTRRMKRTATVFFNSLPVGPLRRCRLELDLENSLGIVVATTTIDFVVTR